MRRTVPTSIGAFTKAGQPVLAREKRRENSIGTREKERKPVLAREKRRENQYWHVRKGEKTKVSLYRHVWYVYKELRLYKHTRAKGAAFETLKVVDDRAAAPAGAVPCPVLKEGRAGVPRRGRVPSMHLSVHLKLNTFCDITYCLNVINFQTGENRQKRCKNR